MRWILDAYAERRTWRGVLYLLSGLPLGVLGFVLLVTGISLGLGLLVTLLGIPVLVVTVLVARTLASFERRLAWTLLDAPMPSGGRPRDEPERGLWRRLRAMLTGARTWWELGFLLLRFPLGLLDFLVVTTIAALAFSGLVQPIVVAAGADNNVGSWRIDTFWESLVLVPVSIVFLVVGPRLVLAWTRIPAWFATTMLGRLDQRDVKRAVVRTLARTGAADGFRLLDELELQFGRGPFLTATRVEAALLALESTGHVVGHRDGGRILYALS
jgi:putative sensor protein